MLTFEEAKELLSKATRWELKDHAFGDMEFGWTDAEGRSIADGYSGQSVCHVTIYNDDVSSRFSDGYAYELRGCGTLGSSSRNDETGPDEYVEGQCMPGLTTEGVYKELTES